MKITMRLYKNYDLDLMWLYKDKDFNFTTALYYAVKHYLKGQPYLMYLPNSKDLSKIDFPSTQRFSWIVDEKKDPEIAAFLESVKGRARNAILKAILRSSLVGVNLAPYFAVTEENEKINKLNLAYRDRCPNCFEPLLKSNKGKNKPKNTASKKALNKILSENNEVKDNTISSNHKEEEKVVAPQMQEVQQVPTQVVQAPIQVQVPQIKENIVNVDTSIQNTNIRPELTYVQRQEPIKQEPKQMTSFEQNYMYNATDEFSNTYNNNEAKDKDVINDEIKQNSNTFIQTKQEEVKNNSFSDSIIPNASTVMNYTDDNYDVNLLPEEDDDLDMSFLESFQNLRSQ